MKLAGDEFFKWKQNRIFGGWCSLWRYWHCWLIYGETPEKVNTYLRENFAIGVGGVNQCWNDPGLSFGESAVLTVAIRPQLISRHGVYCAVFIKFYLAFHFPNSETMSQYSENSNLVGRVLQSVFFRRAQRQAGRLARNSQSLLDLVMKASAKSEGMKNSLLVDNLRTLSRLVRNYAKGRYKVVPWATLLKIIAALVYFVSPIDFIPDLLPIIGFADDIAVVLWVVKSCADDIEKFRAWEAAQAA